MHDLDKRYGVSSLDNDIRKVLRRELVLDQQLAFCFIVVDF